MNRAFELHRLANGHPPPDLPARLGLRAGRHRAGRAARSVALLATARGADTTKTGGSLARGDQPTALADQGKAGDPPLHGRRAVAVREPRLQADAQEIARQALPRIVHEGPAARPAPEHGAEGARAVLRFPQARPVGAGDLRPVPAHRGNRRRDLHRPLDDHRADQSRPGPRVHEHRLDHQGPAEHGLVAALRAGGRDRRPARLHRPDLAGQGGGQQPVSARQWSSGFLPSKFQGIQFQSRGDAVHYIGNPDGRLPETQRPVVEEINRLNGMLAEDAARSRDPDPDRPVRAGVPDAVVGPRADRLRQRAARASSTCTASRQPGDGSFASNCLLARRLAERGVRYDPALPPGLGPPRRHRARHAHRRARGRPGVRGAGQRPRSSAGCSTTRWSSGAASSAAPRWARARAATITSSASRSGWPAAASRAARPMAPPTSSATRPSKTSCTCTTCTPRSCTSAASTTRRLTYKFQGLDVKLTGVEPARVVKELLA